MPIVQPRRVGSGFPAAGGRGNDSAPNAPFRSPIGGGDPYNPAALGGDFPAALRPPQPAGLLPVMQYAAPLNYRYAQTLTFDIPFGESRLILPEPSGVRSYLKIRSSRNRSDLACYISFNTEQNDEGAANFELLPGEWFAYENFFIPQNRIYAFAAPIGAETAGDVRLIVEYSDIAVTPAA